MATQISLTDVESHLNNWFGRDWSNQTSAQVLAMTINLLDIVGVKLISKEEADITKELEQSTSREFEPTFIPCRNCGEQTHNNMYCSQTCFDEATATAYEIAEAEAAIDAELATRG